VIFDTLEKLPHIQTALNDSFNSELETTLLIILKVHISLKMLNNVAKEFKNRVGMFVSIVKWSNYFCFLYSKFTNINPYFILSFI